MNHEAQERKEIKIFISYAHEDKQNKDEFIKNSMMSLKRKYPINIWHDKKLLAGENFQNEIILNLENSKVIILLVSNEFIKSDFICEKELPLSIEKAKIKKAEVLPIILQHCHWKPLGFYDLKVLPEEGRPIASWPDKHKVYADISKEIEKVIIKILNRNPNPDPYNYKKKFDDIIKSRYEGKIFSSNIKKYNISGGRFFYWDAASGKFKDYRALDHECKKDATMYSEFDSLENGIIAYYIQEATTDISKFIATLITKISNVEYTTQVFTNWKEYAKNHKYTFNIPEE